MALMKWSVKRWIRVKILLMLMLIYCMILLKLKKWKNLKIIMTFLNLWFHLIIQTPSRMGVINTVVSRMAVIIKMVVILMNMNHANQQIIIMSKLCLTIIKSIVMNLHSMKLHLWVLIPKVQIVCHLSLKVAIMQMHRILWTKCTIQM